MNSKILKIAPIGLHWETQDPFLFCAYHRDEYPAGNDKMGVNSKNLNGRNEGQDFTLKNGWRMYHGNRVPGFPYHPHRGFETITINKEGVVDHSDSLGAKGRFMEGDVQWMTAGKGIQHSEMFPLIYPDKPNPLEIFQVWLNLPKKNKFVNPHFKMLWKEDIPVINIQDKNGKGTKIEIIAGELNKTKALKPTPNSWAANPNNSVGIFTIKMEAHAHWTLPAIKVALLHKLVITSLIFFGSLFVQPHSLFLKFKSTEYWHIFFSTISSSTQVIFLLKAGVIPEK